MKSAALLAFALGITTVASAQSPRAKQLKIAPAPAIDIKGFHLGMPESEAEELYRGMAVVSVAGVPAKYEHSPLSLKYEDGKLISLTFFFNPTGFSDLRDAVKEKYGGMKCEASEVANRMGAKFTQQDCTFVSSGAILSITKFVGDIETSVLSLRSTQSLSEEAKSRKKAASRDL